MVHAARLHANPLRHHLLYEYAGAPTSPSDLARRLEDTLNLISYHTRVLLRQGVIELVRTERRRGGTAHIYRATVAPVVEDDGWTELPAPVRRMLVRGVLAAVTDASREAALSGGFDAATAHVDRWLVRLDAAALQAVAAGAAPPVGRPRRDPGRRRPSRVPRPSPGRRRPDWASARRTA